MKFPKVVADNYADGIVVETANGNVYIHNRGVPSTPANLKVDYAFDPDSARQLAKALKKAADAAEDYS